MQTDSDTVVARAVPAPNAYPTLLAPITVGEHQLSCRVLMGSMHTAMENLDHPVERMAMFYAARARGGAGLIVTGGFGPNEDGRIDEHAPLLVDAEQAVSLRPIADAVHAEGGKILLQILHAGRYAKVPVPVGASSRPSRINARVPRALTTEEAWQTIEDYVRCAELAMQAGFDGVEVMGSEGYLINQFTVTRTNDRNDEFGGSLENRLRFPVEIVRRIRARLGAGALLMFRLSALDLVEDGSTADEVIQLACAVEEAGADILNTGIGWHESRVPTIAHFVPRGAWRFASARIKKAVKIPVIASNRINTPELAEDILARGEADMVSMARPFLADPDFVRKARAGARAQINICVACNQACLDYILRDKPVACLVNPRAGREFDNATRAQPAGPRQRVAVVGAGAAGLACAVTAAERGHDVTLYEAGPVVGGQLLLARAVPGKDEFDELLRYFSTRLATEGVKLQCGTRVDASQLKAQGYDSVVVASGVLPRVPDIPGIDHAKVASYADILSGRVKAGHRVAVLGAGGIGFDVALFLVDERAQGDAAIHHFQERWGIDTAPDAPGGLKPAPRQAPRRQVTLMQRKPDKPGRGLGLSTGWALKAEMEKADVAMLSGCSYERIDDAGLHISVGGEPRLLEVDTIVLCTGQESEGSIAAGLKALGVQHTVIGGASRAAELDALAAIEDGTRVALAL